MKFLIISYDAICSTRAQNWAVIPYHTPKRILSQLEKYNFFRREEKPNFNLTLLNCKVAIAITIVIFGYKELYNLPKIGLQ